MAIFFVESFVIANTTVLKGVLPLVSTALRVFKIVVEVRECRATKSLWCYHFIVSYCILHHSDIQMLCCLPASLCSVLRLVRMAYNTVIKGPRSRKFTNTTNTLLRICLLNDVLVSAPTWPIIRPYYKTVNTYRPRLDQRVPGS